MRRPSRSCHRLVVPVLLLAALTGCTQATGAAAPDPTSTAASAPAPSADLGTTLPALDDDADDADDPVDGIDWERIEAMFDAEQAAAWARKPLMERIWLTEAPSGPVTGMALRFVRALQRHDDEAAAVELSLAMRDIFLASMPEAHLHRVLADVRRNTGVDQAPPCRRARPLDSDSVVVACGDLRVVVHVKDTFDTGVNLTPWRGHRDVYPGPHRHAFVSPSVCPQGFVESLAC